MTYVSPYVTNNLPRPTDLVIDLDEENGETSLSWDYEEKDFLHFNVYKDGELLGTTTETSYSDNLADYGVYDYLVTAMHDDGESTGAAASIQWGNPHISTNPDAIIENLLIGASSVKTLTIHNVGELQLDYNIGVEITSNKGTDAYCDASGGGDEFISNVEFGDISNSSPASGYADYTDQSTLVNMGDSYDITITNGNVYTADDLGIWIDWNQDDDFEDDGENVVCEVSNSGQGTYSISIPNTAVPGQTTMRIRIKWSDDDCGSPCGSTTYGEVEDYSVYVLGWLVVSPTSGEIAAGESEDITLSFDAADLGVGVYTANLNILSNDPDAATTVIPVTLNVGEDIPEVIATADPAEICAGESTQLNSEVVGGTEPYDYSWTSFPEGFTSDIADPIVEPDVTTTYSVAVFDGTFTVVEAVEVVVNPLPEVSFALASDSTCANYPNFALEGGLPEGGEYSGEFVTDGEFSPIDAGAGTHVVTYTYSDENSCANSAEAEIFVGECLGIGEFADNINVEIYPNPNNGVFTLNLNTSGTETVNISVMDNIGGEVYKLDNVSVTNTYKNEINLSELADGLYYIHITSGDSYYLKKIVIRK